MDSISNFLNPFRQDLSDTQRQANEKIEEINEKKSKTQEALEGIGAPFLEEGITRTTGILGKVAKNYAKDNYGVDIEKYEKLADSYVKGGKAGLQKELYRTVAEKGQDIGEKFTGLDKEAQERIANSYASQKVEGTDLKSILQNAKLRKDLVDNEQAKAQISGPQEPAELPEAPAPEPAPRPEPAPEQAEPPAPAIESEGSKIRNMSDAYFKENVGSDPLKERFQNLNPEQQEAFRQQFQPRGGQAITRERMAQGHDIIDSLEKEAGPQDFIGQVVGEDDDRRIGQQEQDPAPEPAPAPEPGEAPPVPDPGPGVGDAIEQGAQKVEQVGEQVGEKVASFGEDTEKALAVATEGSEALDESPVGLLLTAGLGLATVFTGIFGVHKRHEINNPQPINPTVQIGV